MPERKGDKMRARKELGLPLDKHIILCYAKGSYKPFLPKLPDDDLKEVLFLILTSHEFECSDYPQTLIHSTGPLRNEDLDKYAFASDAIILHKSLTSPIPKAVISTAAYFFIGTMRPILAPKISDSFECFNEEVLKYSDRNELKELIIDVLNRGPRTIKALKAIKSFFKNHSPKKLQKLL